MSWVKLNPVVKTFSGEIIYNYRYTGTGHFPEVVSRLTEKIGKPDYVSVRDKLMSLTREQDEKFQEILNGNL